MPHSRKTPSPDIEKCLSTSPKCNFTISALFWLPQGFPYNQFVPSPLFCQSVQTPNPAVFSVDLQWLHSSLRWCWEYLSAPGADLPCLQIYPARNMSHSRKLVESLQLLLSQVFLRFLTWLLLCLVLCFPPPAWRLFRLFRLDGCTLFLLGFRLGRDSHDPFRIQAQERDKEVLFLWLLWYQRLTWLWWRGSIPWNRRDSKLVVRRRGTPQWGAVRMFFSDLFEQVHILCSFVGTWLPSAKPFI